MNGNENVDANENVRKMSELVDSSKIVELSWPLSPKTPALWGAPPFKKEWVVTRESGSVFEYSSIFMSEHAGTHADAPCHFGYEGDIASVPASRFMGRAAVIKLDMMEVETGHIKAWEAENGAIGEGDIVLFSLGWEDKFYDGLSVWPGITVEAAKYLVEKTVKGVGVDVAAIDVCRDGEHLTHQVLLPARIVIYENLRNLKDLPPFCYFIGLPLMVEGGSATPIRAIAVI